MNKKTSLGSGVSIAFIALGFSSCSKAPEPGSPGRLDAATMRRIGTVDERFQSYNVEMVDVVGGRFWKPYKDIDTILSKQAAGKSSSAESGAPTGMDPKFYQQRQPIDLANSRLRKLAAALGPAYVRVSGTWANTTYFHDSDTPAPKTPPKGFGGVLSRPQWKGVVDFAHAVDAKLVTSFATGM